MTLFAPCSVALACHRDCTGRSVRAVGARLRPAATSGLALSYVVEGEVDRLRIPALQAPHRADRLWEHTCFEAFVGRAGEASYREFNFSPCGGWAAYAFRGYREGAILAHDLQPQIVVRRGTDRLELDAVLAPVVLPPGPLRLALSAVIEEADGARSYWALRHPQGKPDFHHAEAFALMLDATHRAAPEGTR